MLILTSDDMFKAQLIEEILALTDDKEIWLETKREFKKHEFYAILIDEVDVWSSDNACIFLENDELARIMLLDNISWVQMFTATITDLLK